MGQHNDSCFNQIQKILEEWFLTEPLLFSVLCTHKLVQNDSLHIPMRTGKGKIEFSEPIAATLTPRELEQYLRVETIRILLKHPYQRQPIFAIPQILTYASNYTICDSMKLDIQLEGVGLWNLEKGLCFEEYYARILEAILVEEAFSGDGEQKIKQIHSDDSDSQDDGNNCQSSNSAQTKQKKQSGNSNAQKNDIDEEYENNDDGVKNANDGTRGKSDGINQSENDIQNNHRSQMDDMQSLDDNDGQGDGEHNTDCGNSQSDGNDQSEKNMQAGAQLLPESIKAQDGRDATDSPSSVNSQKASEASALWEEDLEQEVKINELIEDARNSKNWGTITGRIGEIIIASMSIIVDYRKMLSFYHTSILSSKRHLTRMRPSRRYGFAAMGSRYELKSNLLVAVDVSGSISDIALSKFYSIINRFFKYGIERIDVIQFDTELKGDPVSLKKACREVHVLGGGGTSFEPALSFCAEHREYDGLIMFTDGYAPIPDQTPFPVEILWILDSYENYCNFLLLLEKVKKRARFRVTYIPLPKGTANQG